MITRILRVGDLLFPNEDPCVSRWMQLPILVTRVFKDQEDVLRSDVMYAYSFDYLNAEGSRDVYHAFRHNSTRYFSKHAMSRNGEEFLISFDDGLS